ncbi:MAG TPA: tetratricopeptide repeat protein [Thermoanaerobaculia bacterium]
MPSRASKLLVLAALLALSACGGYGRPNQASSQLAFGVDMAKRGLWDEALFRFREAERLDPDNPRIQSDLGVAYEAAGQFDKALGYYQKALKLAPNDKGIRTNYARFVEFYQGFKGDKTAKSGAAAGPKATSTTHKAAPPAAPKPKPQPEPSTPGDTPPPPADNRPPS